MGDAKLALADPRAARIEPIHASEARDGTNPIA
jgi:hypothetical protein